MPTELIYNILTGILYIGIPFLITILIVTSYNGFVTIRDGISTTLNELSQQIVLRNNEVPKLIEEIKGIIGDELEISEVQRTKQNIRRAVELRDSERISKAESAFKKQIDVAISVAAKHPNQERNNIISTIQSMNENIQEITNQYNFKVKYFNHSISSLPLAVFAKPLNMKKLNEINYG